MNKFSNALQDAIETTCANNSKKRKVVYDKARYALSDWFIGAPAPTNERMEQMLLLESAITNTESRLKWMQIDA